MKKMFAIILSVMLITSSAFARAGSSHSSSRSSSSGYSSHSSGFSSSGYKSTGSGISSSSSSMYRPTSTMAPRPSSKNVGYTPSTNYRPTSGYGYNGGYNRNYNNDGFGSSFMGSMTGTIVGASLFSAMTPHTTVVAAGAPVVAGGYGAPVVAGGYAPAVASPGYGIMSVIFFIINLVILGLVIWFIWWLVVKLFFNRNNRRDSRPRSRF